MGYFRGMSLFFLLSPISTDFLFLTSQQYYLPPEQNNFIIPHVEHLRRFWAFHPRHMEYHQQGPRRSQLTPLKIRFPGTDDPQIVQIACGSNHVLALSKSGHVYSWGSPDMEILGRRFNPRRAHERDARFANDPYENMQHHFAPGLVCNLKNIRYIACGANFSFAVSKPLTRGSRRGAQVCYVWGQNDDLQTTLPLSKAAFIETPEHPDVPNGKARVVLYPEEAPWLSNIGHARDEPETVIKEISGAFRYGLAIRRNGWGDAWGDEHEVPYAMGVVDRDNNPVIPAVVPGNRWGSAPTFGGFHYFREGVRWTKIATGKTHTIAVDDEGKVYVCGSNDVGQCGVPDWANRDENWERIHTIERPTLLQNYLEPGLHRSVLTGRIATFVGAGARYSVIGFARNRHRIGDGEDRDDRYVSSPEFDEGDFEVGGD